jgi:hypothetical protein
MTQSFACVRNVFQKHRGTCLETLFSNSRYSCARGRKFSLLAIFSLRNLHNFATLRDNSTEGIEERVSRVSWLIAFFVMQKECIARVKAQCKEHAKTQH